MLRIVLFALLTLALNVAAIAHCRVGGMSMSVLGADASHDHKADCDKPEKRVCDAMVQMTAPDQSSIAPALVKSDFAPLVFAPSLATTLANTPSLRQWHPPPDGRASSFKEIYARTGRLLV